MATARFVKFNRCYVALPTSLVVTYTTTAAFAAAGFSVSSSIPTATKPASVEVPWRALRSRAGFVNHQRSPLEDGSVTLLDRLIGVLLRPHFHEGKAPGLA